MLSYFLARFREEEGQGLAEYALILALVTIAVIGLLQGLGVEINAVFTRISGDINTALGS